MGKKRSAWRGKFKHLFWLLHRYWTRIHLMKLEDWLNSQSPHLVIKQILVPFFNTRNHFTVTRIWYRTCPWIWIGDSIHRLSVKSLPVNRITSSPSSMDDPGASCNAVLPSPFTARGLAPLHRQICKWKKMENDKHLFPKKKKHAFNFHESVHGKKTGHEGNVLPSYTRIVFEVKYNCVGFYPQNHKDQHCSYVDNVIDATTKHSGRKWPRDLQLN